MNYDNIIKTLELERQDNKDALIDASLQVAINALMVARSPYHAKGNRVFFLKGYAQKMIERWIQLVIDQIDKEANTNANDTDN